jgi:hypothetical protein
MNKHDMEYDHFVQAEESPINKKYLPLRRDGHREHFRPGRMHAFRDEDGKLAKTPLETCSRCNKVKDDVRDECRRRLEESFNTMTMMGCAVKHRFRQLQSSSFVPTAEPPRKDTVVTESGYRQRLFKTLC